MDTAAAQGNPQGSRNVRWTNGNFDVPHHPVGRTAVGIEVSKGLGSLLEVNYQLHRYSPASSFGMAENSPMVFSFPKHMKPVKCLLC